MGVTRNVFHLQLKQSVHTARAFNLSEQELHERFLRPLVVQRESLSYQDREWDPRKLKLTIYEGPQLRPDEIGLGRGWSNATRSGADVTERVLAAAQAPPRDPALERLKERLLGRLAAGPIALAEAVPLADGLTAGPRASDRLGLTELAVWELLHDGHGELIGDGGEPVAREVWEPALLGWPAWSGGTVSLRARSHGNAG